MANAIQTMYANAITTMPTVSAIVQEKGVNMWHFSFWFGWYYQPIKRVVIYVDFKRKEVISSSNPQ